ncbi:MAG: DegT/DnrJ/EryC1/StrS family aminotransferase, partial [Prevotella sp.]|nr:DegT/DnrJ/EryC1/StrS family aminotransferase [Prevotella sp.]
MTTEYLSLKKITALHGEEIQAAVDRVVRNGWYLQGEATQDFETRYAHYI